jgi:hypothetical protein
VWLIVSGMAALALLAVVAGSVWRRRAAVPRDQLHPVRT